jgi:hypothetical protein
MTAQNAAEVRHAWKKYVDSAVNALIVSEFYRYSLEADI